MILYTELSDYFLACLKELGNKFDEIHIVHWPTNKEAPFDFNIPNNVVLHINNQSLSKLKDLASLVDPSIILCSGWVDNKYLKIVKKFRKKIPTVLLFDNQWKGSPKQILGSILSPFFLKNIFSNVWVTGKSAKYFAEKLGFLENQILTGLYSADTLRFSKYSEQFKKEKQTNFPKVFLYVGRYVNHKGIFDLWNAFIELQNEEPNDWELWCLGTGVEYENRVLHPKIKHFGFIQPYNMFKYLSKSGVYILPSIIEPWGVSVHEMAASSYPLLLSDKVGSSELFLQNSKNGYLFSSGNVKSLKGSMNKIINLKDSELIAMGNRSFELSLSITPKLWAEKLMSLI